MWKENSVIVISLSVTCFVLLCSTAVFYAMKEGEKNSKGMLQKSLDDITGVRKALEAGLKETEMVNAEIKSRLKSQEEMVTAMTQRLQEEKTANNNGMLKIKEKEEKLLELTASLNAEKAQKKSLLEKLEKAKEECVLLKSELKNVFKSKEETEKKVKELTDKKEEVSLGTVVINKK